VHLSILQLDKNSGPSDRSEVVVRASHRNLVHCYMREVSAVYYL
jgi:hypothetical protein